MKKCPKRNLAVFLVAPYSLRLLPPLAIATLISLFLHGYAEGETRVLSGHVPATAAVAQPVGRLARSTRLSLAIGVPLRDRDGLTNFLAQVYDPASPLYHQYLSSPQFTARFGPTVEDYQNVLEFARANGFQITGVHPNRMLVDVNASVSDIERAFHLNLRVYRHPSESRDFYAPDTEPAIDVSLPVLRVSGLDNYTRPRPASLRHTSSGNGSDRFPAIGTGPGGSYQGKDFRSAYASGVTLTGVGQMVGLLEFDGFFQSDIATYELKTGLPNVPIETVLTDGANGSAGASQTEVDLDIEMVISMAPGVSRVIVYEAGANGLPDDILNRMATDNLAKQLSGSWAFVTDATTTQIFMQFAAQGQTFFSASGSGGAYVGAPYQGPYDPYITLVGGTTLSNGPSGAWVSETVWSQGTSSSSGGGVATNFSIPSWQQGLNMSTNQGSTSFRNSPDVAMVAANVWVTYDNGNSGVFGGTGCAAPLWAGFIALVNQQAVSLGQPTVGFLNPAIYAIGTGAGYATNFHDITVGNNTNAASSGLYNAVAGYDLCTGWGSPIGQALIDTLAPRVKAPVVTNAGATLIAEGCLPSNGVIDPGETVTVNFALKNLGAFQTTNLVASLQADFGVVLPSGPQPYGALSAGGAAVSRPFTFTANAPCGGMLTATLLLTDGQANLGAATFDFPIGKPVTVMAQNFDSVTAPALPSGWTSATISNASNWVTSTNAKDSGVLSAFAPEPPTPGVAELTAPPIQITTSTAQLIFQNYYNTETDPSVTNIGMAYDGGVLEIQIGTNAFTDILAAGGSFVSGGYTQTILTNDDNPLDGRRVWGGNSGGFIPTVVNLPATAAGQTIRLKWRFGTDSGSYYGGLGWYIDTISINDGYACCNSSADLEISQVASLDPAFLDRDTTYTITVTNHGPEPAYNVVVTDQLAANVTLTSASPGYVYTNGSVICALGTITTNGGTNVLITVNPFTIDAITNHISVASVTSDPNSTNNVSTLVTSVSGISPPFVTVQPTNVLVAVGDSVEFQTAAQGAPALMYQWLFNGTNITGATSTVLSLSNVQLLNAGEYSVEITNSYGAVTSAVARLTVMLPPSLSINSADVSTTNVIVSLNSVVGVTYTLQYKNSLRDSTWTDILPSVPGTDGVLLLHDTNGSLLSSRFYRVRSD